MLSVIRQFFKDESMSQTTVFKWHKLFKDGRESVEDESRAGQPSTSRTDGNEQRVREVLNSDRRLSVRMIAYRIGIDKMTVHTIITDAEDLHQTRPEGLDGRPKAEASVCLQRSSVTR